MAGIPIYLTRKSMGKIRIGLIGMVLLLAACGPRKKVAVASDHGGLSSDSIGMAIPSGRTAAELRNLPWTWFSGKAELKTEAEGNTLNLTAFFRMKRDSVIWLSVSPGLGITAIRAIITRDSVKILNFIEKYYSVYGIASLQNQTGISLGLTELQHLFAGLPVFDSVRYHYDSSFGLWAARRQDLKNQLGLRSHGGYTSTDYSVVSQETTGRTIRARYEGRKSSNENPALWLPAVIDLVAEAQAKSTKAKLTLTDLSSAPVYQYPFAIPAHYERR